MEMAKTVVTFVSAISTAMMHWTWDDDEGVPHEQVIPNSCCTPSGKICLLSPQHWSQKELEKQEMELAE